MSSLTFSSIISDIHMKNRNTESPLQCLLYNGFDRRLANSSVYIAEYCANLKYLIEDFHELLQLDMTRFWGKILSDKTILQSIDSYLTKAPREYCKEVGSMPEKVRSLHEELHRSVFFLLIRCATTKSKQETTTLDGDYHARLIYDNYIFDVPRLMDFIILYGRENGKLVHSMVSAILSKQPRYKEDFLRVFANLDGLLDRICTDLQIEPTFSKFFEKHQKGFSQRLSTVVNRASSISTVTEKEGSLSRQAMWIDALLYVRDIVRTYESLLHLNPSGRADHKTITASDLTNSPLLSILVAGNVGMKLAAFYELFIPNAHQWYQDVAGNGCEPVWCENESVGQLIAKVSYQLIRVANQILQQYHLRDDRGETALSGAESLEKLLHTWQFLIMSFPLFTCASDAVSSIRQLFLGVKCPEESSNNALQDKSRVQYLITSIDLIYDEMEQTKPLGFFAYERRTGAPTTSALSQSKKPLNLQGSLKSNGSECEKYRDSINTIQSIFPHFSDEQVLKHLIEQNYDVEKTISCLCDVIPEEPIIENEEEYVSSSDEESVETAEAYQLDSDEKRQILERYQYEPEEEDDEELNLDDVEGLSLDELEKRWQTRMLLGSRPKWVLEMEDEYDDTYDSNIPACEKELGAPEKVEAGPSNRNPHEMSNQNREFRPAYLDKVKGDARGHGQSSDTLHSRHLKEKNKAKFGNHNRRYLADKKRRGY